MAASNFLTKEGSSVERGIKNVATDASRRSDYSIPGSVGEDSGKFAYFTSGKNYKETSSNFEKKSK